MGSIYSSHKNPSDTSSIDVLTDEEIYTLIRKRSGDTAIRAPKDPIGYFPDTVWRISQDAIVKLTHSPTEVFMMSYVSSHTSIPVPKVRRVLPVVDSTGSSDRWIVMDYISGDTLETIWPRMSWWKRLYVAWLTRRYIQELQSIPIPNSNTPGPFDDSGRRYGCSGYYFTEDEAGPFDSYLDMAEWFDRRRFDVMAATHSAIGKVPQIPKFDNSCPLVLCHMDLHMRNFIIDVRGKLWIVDWEKAGAFPPWLEHAFMAIWDDASREEARPPKSWTFLIRFMAGDYRRYKTDYLDKLNWAWCRPLYDYFSLDYFSDLGLIVE